MTDYTATITITHSITAGSDEKAQERADQLAEAYGAAKLPKAAWVGDQQSCDAEIDEG